MVKQIYLYLKIHNKTNLKYLGMTIQDPYEYMGSGVYWTKHLKHHGYDVSTIILKCCGTYEEIAKWGKYYSDLWEVVESNDFANLVPELGQNSSGMGGKVHSAETKEKISNSLVGHEVAQETRQKISEKHLGVLVPWNKGISGEYHIFSDEEKQKRSINYSGEGNPFFNKEHTTEFKEHQRQNQKRVVICPHCNKEGAIRIMKRWHFSNCKFYVGKE